MLEFVLCFPLILTLILGAAQFGHIWMARQVVSYAAYAAARAALVAEEGEYEEAGRQAAEQVCAWISVGQAAGEAERPIPGWGEIPGSGAADRKTQVTVEQLDDWNIKATVSFDLALVMPIAGAVIGWGVNPLQWEERRADATGDRHRHRDSVQYPHIRFEETVVLAKPYRTMPRQNLPLPPPAAGASAPGGGAAGQELRQLNVTVFTVTPGNQRELLAEQRRLEEERRRLEEEERRRLEEEERQRREEEERQRQLALLQERQQREIEQLRQRQSEEYERQLRERQAQQQAELERLRQQQANDREERMRQLLAEQQRQREQMISRQAAELLELRNQRDQALAEQRTLYQAAEQRHAQEIQNLQNRTVLLVRGPGARPGTVVFRRSDGDGSIITTRYMTYQAWQARTIVIRNITLATKDTAALIDLQNQHKAETQELQAQQEQLEAEWQERLAQAEQDQQDELATLGGQEQRQAADLENQIGQEQQSAQQQLQTQQAADQQQWQQQTQQSQQEALRQLEAQHQRQMQDLQQT